MTGAGQLCPRRGEVGSVVRWLEVSSSSGGRGGGRGEDDTGPRSRLGAVASVERCTAQLSEIPP